MVDEAGRRAGEGKFLDFAGAAAAGRLLHILLDAVDGIDAFVGPLRTGGVVADLEPVRVQNARVVTVADPALFSAISYLPAGTGGLRNRGGIHTPIAPGGANGRRNAVVEAVVDNAASVCST